MKKKGFSNILLVILVVLVAALIAYKKGFLNLNNSTVPKESENSTEVNTTQDTQKLDNFYSSGTEIGRYKFSINYPQGWEVRIAEDSTLEQYDENILTRFNISLIPPEVIAKQGNNLLWGGLSIDVYPAVANIEEYLNNTVKIPLGGTEKRPNKREYYTYTTLTIRNKMGYQIGPSDKYPQELLAGYTASPIVVIGKYYTYVISHFQNGETGFYSRIQKDIFPTLKFE